MQLTLEHIEQEMFGEGLSPGQLADFRTYLAALGSSKTGELQDILSKKPAIWLRIREGKNSDKAADREWDATAAGIREMELRMLLKRIDRLTSALASKLRVMEWEIRNQA
jgi:hypothetical protein